MNTKAVNPKVVMVTKVVVVDTKVVDTKMNQVTTRGSADAGLGAPDPPNKKNRRCSRH
jgi:hypothetical protein